MRTTYKEKKDKQVYRVFPLLYERCEICKEMFKFELGWKYVHSQSAGIDFEYTNLYVCERCLPKYEQAYEYFKYEFFYEIDEVKKDGGYISGKKYERPTCCKWPLEASQ